MKTTVNIDEKLLKKAVLLSGINETTELLNKSLKSLIEIESSRRLALLEKSEKNIKKIRRRKSLI